MSRGRPATGSPRSCRVRVKIRSRGQDLPHRGQGRCCVVSTAPDELRGREHLGIGDAQSGVRRVDSRTKHDNALPNQRLFSLILRLRPSFVILKLPVVMLKSLFLRRNVGFEIESCMRRVELVGSARLVYNEAGPEWDDRAPFLWEIAMSLGGEPGPIPHRTTRQNRHRSVFCDKHHRRGGLEAAQWALDLREDEEYGIFDQADELDLSDDRGDRYGIRPGPEPEHLSGVIASG